MSDLPDWAQRLDLSPHPEGGWFRETWRSGLTMPQSALPQDYAGARAAGTAILFLLMPGLPLGVTTGFWALSDPDERLRAVQAWTVLPDFASVNWHEPGSEQLARLLLNMGLGVEAGIFTAEAAAAWARSDIAAHCMRVMVELGPDGDIAMADDVLSEVLAAGSPAPVLLHGFDESCWPLLEHASARGVQARIGMEDTLTLPDGSTAQGNAELVAAAVQLLNR